jgi:hypothetical protein
MPWMKYHGLLATWVSWDVKLVFNSCWNWRWKASSMWLYTLMISSCTPKLTKSTELN